LLKIKTTGKSSSSCADKSRLAGAKESQAVGHGCQEALYYPYGFAGFAAKRRSATTLALDGQLHINWWLGRTGNFLAGTAGCNRSCFGNSAKFYWVRLASALDAGGRRTLLQVLVAYW